MHSKFSQRFKSLKVVIALPHNGQVMGDFARDVANLAVAVSTHRILNYKDQTVSFFWTRDSILTRARKNCVKEALNLKADYLLFIDADQTFPRKLLHVLISREVDVVAANIATKQIPAQPTARKRGPKGPRDWQPVFTDKGSTGLEQVDRIGTGVFMLSKAVLEKLPMDAFDMFYRHDVDEVQGEDWTMCEAIEELGFKLYIDHDISKEIGHLGTFNYTHEVVGDLVKIEDTDEIRVVAGRGR
jgi:hypothetical protein